MQDPSQELKFGFNVLKEPKNYINILINLSRLIEKPNSKSKSHLKIEDEWILSKLNSLVKTVTEEIENLHIHIATRAIKEFWVNNFSRGYVQFVRERLSEKNSAAESTLRDVYLTLVKLCSPIIPFATEKIWQDLRNQKIVSEESVHLSEWPKSYKNKIDMKLEKRFENVLKFIERGLYEREKSRIGLRWPLAKVTIFVKERNNYKKFEEIIKTQLNVREVSFKSPSSKETEFNLKLDTNLTSELESEGYAREVSRQIQAFRKKLGLNKNQKVDIFIITDDKFKKNLENHKNFIKKRVNAKNLKVVTTTKERFKNKTEFKIKEEKGEIAITS